MSRYFKYKTSQALEADAQRLGLDIPLSTDLSPLLEPITRWRPVSRQPAGDSTHGRLRWRARRRAGRADFSTLSALRRRRGQTDLGRGLRGRSRRTGQSAPACDQSCQRRGPRTAAPNHSPGPSSSRLDSDNDLLVGLQLTHSGRYSCERPILAQHDPLLDPRTILDKTTGATAGPDTPLISDSELERLRDRYAVAAKLAFADRLRLRRYQAMPPLLAQRAAGRTHATGQIRRLVREPNAVYPRSRRSDRPRKSRTARRHSLERLRRRSLHQGSQTGQGIPCPFTLPIKSAWGTSTHDPLLPDLAEPLALIGLLRRAGSLPRQRFDRQPVRQSPPASAIRVPAAGWLRDSRAPDDRG